MSFISFADEFAPAFAVGPAAVAKKVLERGLRTGEEDRLMTLAIDHQFREIIRLAFDRGANHGSAVNYAARSGNTQLLEEVWEYGNVDRATAAFTVALRYNQIETASWLLTKGVSLPNAIQAAVHAEDPVAAVRWLWMSYVATFDAWCAAAKGVAKLYPDHPGLASLHSMFGRDE